MLEGVNFSLPPDQVARALLGCTLLVDGVGGIVVETEAYGPDDPASHAFTGPSARNAAMFGPAGCAYVYRSYGIHWCMNAVCGPPGHGAAVLLRALQPTHGLDAMRARRRLQDERLKHDRMQDDRMLCAGPGRLAQALGIGPQHDGLPLDAPPFAWLPRSTEPALVAGPRIGITKAADVPWRFGLAGSRYTSRPFPVQMLRKK